MLNDFLEKDATHQVWYSFRVHIIRTADDEELAGIDAASTSPAAPFASPFLDWSLDELNDFFIRHIRPLEPFTNSVFIVLDKYSEEDESCDLVGVNGPGDYGSGTDSEGEEEEEAQDEQEPESLRCDYYAARQIATHVELGVSGMFDNRDPNVVHTIATVPLDV